MCVILIGYDFVCSTDTVKVGLTIVGWMGKLISISWGVPSMRGQILWVR
jgi:hypothetical protein